MPTPVQRAASIVDALLNRTASAADRASVHAAFADMLPPTATQAEIAANFIKVMRQVMTDRVTGFESRNNVATAVNNTVTSVNSRLAESP